MNLKSPTIFTVLQDEVSLLLYNNTEVFKLRYSGGFPTPKKKLNTERYLIIKVYKQVFRFEIRSALVNAA